MKEVEQKRSALIIPSFRGGGAEKVIVEIANTLAHSGYLVDVVVLSSEGPYRKNLSSQANLIDLNVNSTKRSIFALRRYLLTVRPDSVLSSGLHMSIALVIAAFLAGSRTRLVVREPLPLNIEMQQNKIFPILTKLFYWRFDVYIALTRCQQRLRNSVVTTRKQSEEFVIPNPLDIEKLRALAGRKPEYTYPDSFYGAKVIVACGRLTTQKNFEHLIKAFAKVRPDHDCRLVILGEGELRRKLESLIESLDLQNDICMPGFVENPHAIVSRASIFVLSSLYEGMPNSLLHACAIGTPCIAIKCDCGPDEIFEYSGTGVLVKPGDLDELANTMSSQLSAGSMRSARPNWVDAMTLEKVSDDYAIALGLKKADGVA